MNILAQNSSLQQTELNIVSDSAKLILTKTLLVSVIIPVYNSSKYIQKAIDSVLAQTYSNYEIIVVDDGSTDNTKSKLERYQDKIRYIYQKNQGSAAARNTGIKLAQGELIAFLDADDLWSMPAKLEKQVACFIADSDLGGVNTGWRIIDGAGKHIKTVQPWHKAPKLDLETWLKKKCVRTSAMIFRRQWLEKVGGFDPEIRQSHDVDLILRLSLAGCKTRWLKEETVCYRQHEENTTKDSLKQAKYVQAVLDKFYARQDLPESIRQQEKQIRYHTLVWIAWYQYNADNLDSMSYFLQRSLDFSPYLRVENVAHWLTSFKRFSTERGQKFNADLVTNSHQWHQLIAVIVGLPTPARSQSASSSVIAIPPALNLSHQAARFAIPPVSNVLKQQRKLLKTASLRQSDNLNFAIAVDSHQVKTEPKPIEIGDESAAELVALADAKVKQQELAAAIDLYSRAVEVERDAWKTHRKLGKAYRQQGQLNLALSHLQQSVVIQPNIGEIHSDLGLTLAQLGKWEEAIAAYTKSIEIKPEQPWSYFKLAALQEKQHDFAAAIESLTNAIEYDPDNSLFYRNLAQVQQLRGNLDASISAYRQAIKINPDLELTVYRNLGQAIKHNAPIKPRLGLKNVAEKLKTKPGKIAYLGGSPTAQADGYLPLLESMLNSYLGQAQTTIKAANGGITSNAAVFTIDRDLIPDKPDLCLIEYSSTDMGKGYDVVYAIEGIVKKLMKIGCQICFLYMYKQGADFDGDDPVLIEYEKVAEFYGIPSINVGKYLASSAKQGKLAISKLLKSKEKTSLVGSKVVAEYIFQGLKEIFATSAQTKVNSFNHHHHQERYISSRNYANGKIVAIAPSMLVDLHNYQTGEFKSYQYLQIDSSNEIEFTIEGELVGIFTVIGRDSGTICFESEGYQKKYQLWDTYCFADRLQAVTIQKYFRQPTEISLKLTNQPVDYSKCIREIENSGKINKSLRIVGLLVSGTIVEKTK